MHSTRIKRQNGCLIVTPNGCFPCDWMQVRFRRLLDSWPTWRRWICRRISWPVSLRDRPSSVSNRQQTPDYIVQLEVSEWCKHRHHVPCFELSMQGLWDNLPWNKTRRTRSLTTLYVVGYRISFSVMRGIQDIIPSTTPVCIHEGVTQHNIMLLSSMTDSTTLHHVIMYKLYDHLQCPKRVCMLAILFFTRLQIFSVSVPDRSSFYLVKFIQPDSSGGFRGKCWLFFIYAHSTRRNLRLLLHRPIEWSFPVWFHTGTIPEFLGELTNMTTLKLSSNQLTGKSPEWTELSRALTANSRYL